MRKQLFGFIVSAVCVLLLASCVTSIPVTLTKPPLLDTTGIKKVTVLHAVFTGESNEGDSAFKTATGKYRYAYGWRKPLESEISQAIRYNIEKVLVETKQFEIIGYRDVYTRVQEAPKPEAAAPVLPAKKRNLLQKMGDALEEKEVVVPDQGFDSVFNNGTGLVDGWFVVEVNHFVTKTVTANDMVKNADGTITPILLATKTVQLEYTLTLIRSSDGMILGSSKHIATAESKTKGQDALAELESELNLYKLALRDDLPELRKDFSSYIVETTRVLEKDTTKNPEMDRAEKLVKAKQYDAALAVYDSVYEQTKIFAAAYNAALMVELGGNLDVAIVRMEALSAETGNPKAATELERMKQDAADQEKLGKR